MLLKIHRVNNLGKCPFLIHIIERMLRKNMQCDDRMHNLGIFSSQGGVEGKRQVDRVIDKCASMQVELIYVAQFFSCVIKNIVLLLFRKTCFHDHV